MFSKYSIPGGELKGLFIAVKREKNNKEVSSLEREETVSLSLSRLAKFGSAPLGQHSLNILLILFWGNDNGKCKWLRWLPQMF